MRALDHVVWPARDLEALTATFRALGFTVGPRNRHPWGTINHIVQFDGVFVELLGFAEDYSPLPPDDPAFPFAGFCAQVLAKSDGGAAMIVLRSDDAVADAARFRADGLGPGRLLPFSRAAQGPDGRDRTVAFTVAFADLPGLPEIGAFTCQQHCPENFWSPAMQRHPNGATGIAALDIATVNPTTAAATLRRFAGAADGGEPIVDPLRIELENSAIRLGTPSATQNAETRLVAVEIKVASLASLQHFLDAVRLPVRRERDSIIVDVNGAGSTGLAFRAASKPPDA